MEIKMAVEPQRFIPSIVSFRLTILLVLRSQGALLARPDPRDALGQRVVGLGVEGNAF
jgi:hypothetical protein